jgi:toxin ParE1/3/4
LPRVLRRAQAQDDIEDIWNFIADDNVSAADNWLDRLDEQFALLATQPKMGRNRDELVRVKPAMTGKGALES